VHPGDASLRSTVAPVTDAGEPATLLRFSGATRLLHWINAAPFLLLLLTGFLLFLPELKAIHVGGHRLIALVHVCVGIAFIVAIPLTVLLLRNRRALVQDVELALTPERGDVHWLRYAALTALGARLPEPASGKFNAGQKLSSAFWVAVTAGLMGTGAVLGVNYFTKRVFGAQLVEQVYPWHTLLAVFTLPVLAVHLYLALINPATRPSLRGMISGGVDANWARRHHSRWAAAARPAAPPPDRAALDQKVSL
jgi:formate dehydrogenase subunit gamma